MDKGKLDPKILAELTSALLKSPISALSDYSAPKKVKTDEQKTTQEKLDEQKPKHRTILLWLIFGLTIASFLLLAWVVVWQMVWPIRHPDYKGVSDEVVKVLAVGVFAELVGVVAVIARLIWKDK